MISKDKTYRTRDGREVRIYATDGGGPYPVHGAMRLPNFWAPTNWSENGNYKDQFGLNDLDLIEVKPRYKRTVWMNVYTPDNTECVGSAYMTAHDAHQAAAVTRIACIKVDLDFEEGEGISHGTYTVSSGGSHPFDNGGGFTPSVNKVIKEGP